MHKVYNSSNFLCEKDQLNFLNDKEHLGLTSFVANSNSIKNPLNKTCICKKNIKHLFQVEEIRLKWF
jgi:hypothetical protein